MRGYPTLAKLSRPFEASLDAVILVDEDERIVYANPAASRITGYGPHQLLGRDAYGAMPPHAREALRQAIQAHKATKKEPGVPLSGTSVLVRPDSKEIEIEFTAVPLALDGRRSLMVMFRDVTEMKRLAREFKALTQIASQVAFAGSLQATLNKLAENVVRATGTVAAGVCLVDEGTQELRFFWPLWIARGSGSGGQVEGSGAARRPHAEYRFRAREKDLDSLRSAPKASR